MKKILISLLFIVLLTIPAYINNIINNEVSIKQQELLKKGIKVEEIQNNSNYFVFRKKYSLILVDSEKLFSLQNKAAQALNLKRYTNNTRFEAEVNLIQYPFIVQEDINFSLTAVNTTLQKEINESEFRDKIKAFIKNKGIVLNIVLDNFSFASAKLKDINLELKEKENSLGAIIKGLKLQIHNEKDFSYALKELSFKADLAAANKNTKTQFLIKNVDYSYKEKEKFNITEESSLGKMNFSLAVNKKEVLAFEFSNSKSTSNVDTNLNNINLSSKSTTGNIHFYFLDKMKDVKLDLLDTNIKVNLKDINLQAITRLYDLYTSQEYEQKDLERELEKVINAGLIFDIEHLNIASFNLNIMNQNIHFKDVKLDSKMSLEKNTIEMNTYALEALKEKVLAKINFEVNTSDLEKNVLTFPIIGQVLPLFKNKKDKSILESEYKNKQFFINNNRIF